MEFDKSKVYTTLNADELKIGSKVIADDTLGDLKSRVERDDIHPMILDYIYPDDYKYRFVCDGTDYALAYLVEEPEPKWLKWTDLKIGDIIKSPSMIEYLVIGIDRNESEDNHIRVDGIWLNDEELRYWEKVEQKC